MSSLAMFLFQYWHALSFWKHEWDVNACLRTVCKAGAGFSSQKFAMKWAAQKLAMK